MNISKNRLIQIIKEELTQEATPYLPPARDMEINVPPGVGGPTDPIAVGANILSIISSHAQPEQVILAFVELLNSAQQQHLAQVLVHSLAGRGGGGMEMMPPPQVHTPEHPESEYGAKTGMGFVKTREDLERMIGDELAMLLEGSNK